MNEDISDGYHALQELYYQRLIVFLVICNQNKENAWKSLYHADGTRYEGCFIVGIETPDGNHTYYCGTEYWDLFNVTEFDRAPEWDGHKPEDVNRLLSLMG